MTADKKTKLPMASVSPNTACTISAVLRFHMTPSQTEDHVFDLNAISSSHRDFGHTIYDWYLPTGTKSVALVFGPAFTGRAGTWAAVLSA